jgi:predicted exporter
VRSGPDPELPRQVYETYFPRRFLFLSDAPERELPRLLSEGCRGEARRLRGELALPASTLLAEVVPADPSVRSAVCSSAWSGAEHAARVADGQFAGDGRYAIALPRDDAARASTPACSDRFDARGAFERIDAEHGGGLELEQSGLARYVVAGEARAQGDAVWIATLSFLGVGAVLLLALRSPASLGLTLLPGVFGLAAATTVGLLYYGDLDGLTLAFGTTLLGLTIDYPIHLLNHHAMSPQHESARQVARRIAVLALAAGRPWRATPASRSPHSRLPPDRLLLGGRRGGGLRLPLLRSRGFLPDARPLPASSRRFAGALGRAVLALEPHRALAAVAVALGLGSAALRGSAGRTSSPALSAPDPALVAEDARARPRLALRRRALAIRRRRPRAAGPERPVHAALRRARARRARGRAFAPRLPLVARGSRDETGVPAGTPDLPAASSALRGRGLPAPRRSPLSVRRSRPAELRLELAELRASELGQLVGPMILDLGDRTGVVTLLRGLRDPVAVERALEEIPGVRLFDQQSFVTGIYREFRDATVRQMVLGSALVFAVLWLRYRRFRPAFAAVLPSTLVAVAMLGAIGALVIQANLLHAMSLVLVTGQGSDYGIFVVDSADRARDFRATCSPVSCFTTIFA